MISFFNFIYEDFLLEGRAHIDDSGNKWVQKKNKLTGKVEYFCGDKKVSKKAYNLEVYGVETSGTVKKGSKTTNTRTRTKKTEEPVVSTSTEETPTKRRGRTKKVATTDVPVQQEPAIATKVSSKPKTLIEELNSKTRVWELLQKHPFKKCSSVEEYGELCKSFSGLECGFDGIKNKAVAEGITESFYKVLSKYPILAQSECLRFMGTPNGIETSITDSGKKLIHGNAEIKKKVEEEIKKTISEYNVIGGDLYNIYNIGVSGKLVLKDFCKKYKIDVVHQNFYSIKIDKYLQQCINEYATEHLYKQYARLANHTTTMGSGLDTIKGAMAYYHHDRFDKSNRGIVLAPSNMNKSIKLYQYGVDTKQSPKGTNYKSIVTHEFGHALDFFFDINNNADIKKLYSELKRCGMITNRVSSYADTNMQEFIAECFAEYMDSEEPRPVAKKVGEIIDKMYEQYMIEHFSNKKEDN